MTTQAQAALNPLAEAANAAIKSANPTVFALLSARGQRFFFPAKGILAQGAEAKAKAKTDAAAADKEKGQTNASSVSVERTVNIGRKNRTTTAFRRVGRSDANVRVSNVVIPQARPPTRVRASMKMTNIWMF